MRIPRSLSTVLACIALSTVVASWSWWHERQVAPKTNHDADDSTEVAVDNEQKTAPIVVSSPAATPASVSPAVKQEESLAHEPYPEQSLETASDVPDPSGAMDREIEAADRRAAMASSWGLTKQQTEAFDVATEAPSQERLEVMMRFAEGKIADSDLGAALEAADERGLQRVREVLGDERFSEY